MGSSFGGVSRLSGVDAAALAEAPLAHLSPLGSIDSIPELAWSFDPVASIFKDTPRVRDLVLVVEAGHRVRLALALERLLDSIEDCIRPQRLPEGGRASGSAAETPLRGANGPGRIAQSGFAPRGTAHGLLSPGCGKDSGCGQESGCGKDRSSKPTRVNSCRGRRAE